MNHKGRKKETKKVDVSKVREILASNNTTMSALSKQMGFHESYLSGLLRSGELSKFAITYLKNMYNVNYCDYRYMPNYNTAIDTSNSDDIPNLVNDTIIQPTECTVFNISDESINRLSESVYKAVYAAMTQAWRDM